MTSNKPVKTVIGITGNSGSGKTTVAKILSAKGGYAIDADIIAHKVMEPGQRAYKKIVAAFGPDILGQDSKIDRKKLGQVVFDDPEKRTQLETIVHPLVKEEILSEIEALATNYKTYIVIDAVLLVESGLHHYCDVVWLIKAEEKTRKTRITARDNLNEQRAAARMRNQRDTSHIVKIAQAVIENDGDLADLEKKVDAALISY